MNYGHIKQVKIESERVARLKTTFFKEQELVN
jgi:hypothetical protein